MTLPTSLAAIQQQIREDSLTVSDIVRQYLSIIHQYNNSLNAFVEIFDQEALEKAKAIDEKIEQGNAGPLHGMVIGIKDLFCYKGHALNCSSKILDGFESQITATAVQRLIDQDAIIIGRQNCDEFGMGSSNENSFYGPVRNFANENKVPGGSSGGSAVAVQAGMCLLSISSDTGGSIRQPASFTGTYGFKPTYSRISRYGLTAYSSSFDCVGFIANNTEDLALALKYTSGRDENDGTSSLEPIFESKGSSADVEGKKICYFNDLIRHEGVSSQVIDVTDNYIKKLRSEGAEVENVAFPYADYLLPIYYVLTSAEASANLSRFDGVRYGYRATEVENIEQLYKRSRTEGFGPEVIRRILLGTFVLSANYHDAFYVKAMKARSLIKNFVKDLFGQYDFILLPTAPTVAFDLESKTANPIEMYVSDLFTTLASIGGFPAISVPGDKDEEGMPIGIQLIADEFKEAELLSFSDRLVS